ncbi:hypothetical protein Thiosp_02446 [Thiorhodovibrio litoralis]|nr:hypothetical protein Thiosp_02446 [Thiorhodovibrio litoralis]
MQIFRIFDTTFLQHLSAIFSHWTLGQERLLNSTNRKWTPDESKRVTHFLNGYRLRERTLGAGATGGEMT